MDDPRRGYRVIPNKVPKIATNVVFHSESKSEPLVLIKNNMACDCFKAEGNIAAMSTFDACSTLVGRMQTRNIDSRCCLIGFDYCVIAAQQRVLQQIFGGQSGHCVYIKECLHAQLGKLYLLGGRRPPKLIYTPILFGSGACLMDTSTPGIRSQCHFSPQLGEMPMSPGIPPGQSTILNLIRHPPGCMHFFQN